jgi:anti-sigma factor RsiW
MLTCQQMTTLITDYLEGRLPWPDRARFRMHLGMCRHCRNYLRQMKLSVSVLGRMPPDPVPDDVMNALLVQFGDWNR